jgi:hypothetical protein
MVRKVLYTLMTILIVIQFVRPHKNIAMEVSTNDIEKHYHVPENVKVTLKKACRDCHSNHTEYPWYANIQPIAWWLNGHIQDGKKNFNLSEFAAYTPKRADHKLEELIESQEENWMPLQSYQNLHQDAVLTEAQKGEVITWAQGLRKEIQTAHPEAFTKKESQP